ncbi:E3 ubiquitin-protein ligase At3g02290-like [Wolffia australiana]
MGSFCCCLQVNHPEDFSLSSSSSFYGNCLCIRLLVDQLFSAFSSLFQREHLSITSPQLASSEPPDETQEDSIGRAFRAPPRPLPYDDPRFSPLHRERAITRLGKASSHYHEETEPLRSGISGTHENLTQEAVTDELAKPCPSELQLKQWQSDVPYVFDNFEDEDACPTCLEEYTPEDPKISLQCSHHFHLGCIYEWMERSEACPVCGKAMVFSEKD